MEEPNEGCAVAIVLVKCRDCGGTGDAPGGILQCGVCLGQRHVAVDTTMDGTIPDGETAWEGPGLPDVPANPLVLTSAR